MFQIVLSYACFPERSTYLFKWKFNLHRRAMIYIITKANLTELQKQ